MKFIYYGFTFFLLLTSLSAQAATSRTVIPFQGAVAVKPGQEPLDENPYPAKFQIYSAASGGTLLFEDNQSITIRQGVFSVEIGGGSTALDSNIFRTNQDLWLQIAIDFNRSGNFAGAEFINPRTHLGAVPYALYSTRAGRADNANSTDNAKNADVAGTLDLPAELRDDKGVLVAEITENGDFLPQIDVGTDIAPDPGGVFRDNSCIAWGLIDTDGKITSGFGIQSARYEPSTKSYVITLWNDVVTESGEPAYSVTVTSLDFSQRPELAIYEPIDNAQIRVTIFGLDSLTSNNGNVNVPKVTSAFSITVFGRPDVLPTGATLATASLNTTGTLVHKRAKPSAKEIKQAKQRRARSTPVLAGTRNRAMDERH